MNVIRRMNFSGYFLIVKDIVDYAGARHSVGRGGVGGRQPGLYALGITDVDPLRYG